MEIYPINIAHVPSVNKVLDFNDYNLNYEGADSNGDPIYNYEGPTNYPNGEPKYLTQNGVPNLNLIGKQDTGISIIIASMLPRIKYLLKKKSKISSISIWTNHLLICCLWLKNILNGIWENCSKGRGKIKGKKENPQIL